MERDNRQSVLESYTKISLDPRDISIAEKVLQINGADEDAP